MWKKFWDWVNGKKRDQSETVGAQQVAQLEMYARFSKDIERLRIEQEKFNLEHAEAHRRSEERTDEIRKEEAERREKSKEDRETERKEFRRLTMLNGAFNALIYKYGGKRTMSEIAEMAVDYAYHLEKMSGPLYANAHVVPPRIAVRAPKKVGRKIAKKKS